MLNPAYGGKAGPTRDQCVWEQESLEGREAISCSTAVFMSARLSLESKPIGHLHDPVLEELLLGGTQMWYLHRFMKRTLLSVFQLSSRSLYTVIQIIRETQRDDYHSVIVRIIASIFLSYCPHL